ncbi:MAG: SpvB/TcaC N-terminal domain-containing protein, partial [Pseudomonadota bacterium]
MLAKLHRLTWTFLAAAIVMLSAPAYDSGNTAYATPTAQQISDRITQLTGLQPGEIDEIYAAEQAVDIVLIAYEVIIPIVREPRVSYLLVKVAATGQWIRVIIDNAEWDADFRPYLAANGVEIYKQPKGTIDQQTAEQEATQIATSATTDGATVANIVLYGSAAGPSGDPLTSWAATGGTIGDAAFSAPQVPTGDTGLQSVGAVAGNGGVSGGSASYSIPIVVPPGRKGVQPRISLSYSSSNGNGIAGVGWSLSAGSAIQRCPASAAIDNFTAAPQYDASRDRLCLNGQRLMVVSGTYGASGAVYRTELDSFVRVTQSGGINSPSSSFSVIRKDGTAANYGADANSRLSASGRSEVKTWAITSTIDVSGNTITYDYSSFGAGEHLLSAIHYTGINGSDGSRHVTFTYEDRPDTRSGYMVGGLTRTTKRLQKITTSYLSTTVREYSLSYGAVSTYSARSLLRSVTECAFEGAQPQCYKPTNFEWQESAPGFENEQLSFYDPDGLVPGGNPAVVHADKRWLHDIVPQGDKNGDGVKDWADFHVNAEGEVTSLNSEHITNCFDPVHSFQPVCLEADIDADGRTDSFRQNNEKLELRYADETNWFVTSIPWEVNALAGRMKSRPIGFYDVNADGRVDLAMRHTEKLYVYFHNGNDANPYTSASRHLLHSYSYDNSLLKYITDVQSYGDMDGNGVMDFVVSDTTATGPSPGLPRPLHIIEVHPTASGTITTTTRTVPTHSDINALANFFHDVNGDGLSDVLAVNGPSQLLRYKLNTGSGWTANWVDLTVGIPLRDGFYDQGGNGTELQNYVYPVMSKILTMDYDSDGKTEILFADTVVASGCALVLQTTGNTWLCDDALYENYSHSENSRTGQPINGTVKDNSVRQYKGIRFTEDAAGVISASYFSTPIIGSASQTRVVDATGDGLPDVVTVYGCRLVDCEFNTETSARPGTTQDSSYVEGAWINRSLGTATSATNGNLFAYEAPDLMKAVENGFETRTEWTYRPLSSDEYSLPHTDYYQTTHSYQETDPAYFHFASSMNVVAEQRTSNGIGGLNSTLYRYRGAIYNNQGRGFQGFRSIIVEEDVYDSSHALAGVDKVSRTDFYQKWPLSSQVEESCTWLAADAITDDNPDCVSVIAKSVTNSIHDVATVGGARFVAVDDKTQFVYDLTTRAQLSSNQSVQSFDAYGNVTNATTTHSDAYGTTSQSSTNTYVHDVPNWWLNRLTSTVQQSNPVSNRHSSSPAPASGADTTKIITTSMPAYDTVHRLPSTITTMANDSSLSKTVSLVYNSVGLTTSVTTTGSDVTGPRVVSTTYSDNGTAVSATGYFPYTVTNSLGHSAQTQTDARFGQVTQQTDSTGLVATTILDAFGRSKSSISPGQPEAHVRYFWCAPASCSGNMSFRMVSYQAGTPESTNHFDQLGRELQSSVRNFADDGFITIRKSYDARGNTDFESQPYSVEAGESANIGTRFMAFDALGRNTSKESDQANGTIFATLYQYQGLTTTVTAGGLSMHRIYNGLNQLVETRDALNGYT